MVHGLGGLKPVLRHFQAIDLYFRSARLCAPGTDAQKIEPMRILQLSHTS